MPRVVVASKPKRLEEVRRLIRTKHYSKRTEEAYCDWIRRFVLYHGKRHPREMSAEEIQAFLSHLANERKVAASTQNQALSAVLFLYKEVLKLDLPWLGTFDRAQRPAKLPVVFTREEAQQVTATVKPSAHLMVQLLYGCGRDRKWRSRPDSVAPGFSGGTPQPLWGKWQSRPSSVA